MVTRNVSSIELVPERAEPHYGHFNPQHRETTLPHSRSTSVPTAYMEIKEEKKENDNAKSNI